MNHICLHCELAFSISEQDLFFYDRISPVFDGKKCQIPPPTLCPTCRRRRRLSFRNERNLYHGKSAFSGKPVITQYAPVWGYQAYSHEEFFGDSWSGLDYGRDFDFGKPFFDQVGDLWKEVPHLLLTTSVDALENNCPYVNFAGNNKNSHMIFDSDFVEDSYYSNVLKHSRHCMDCYYTEAVA